MRIYAEDPAQNFLPSTGTITQFVKADGPGIRIDSGVDNGDEVTPYYDPMLAKLIVYGEERDAAIARLQKALEQCAIFGVTTNVPLLHAISKDAAFQAGQTHTNFLDEHATLLEAAKDIQIPREVLYAAAIYDGTEAAGESRKLAEIVGQACSAKNPWRLLGPWRMVDGARQITYHWHGQEYHIALTPSSQQADTWHIQINNDPVVQIVCTYAEQDMLLLTVGTGQTRLYIQRQQAETQVALAGQIYHLGRQQPPDIAATAHGGLPVSTQKTLTAPMAGTIVKVQAHDGELVQAKQVLVILSAMKMEHAITAPYEGRVQRIYYQEGAVVPGGTVLVEMA